MKYAIAAVAVVAAIAGGAIAQTSTAPSASSPAASSPAATTPAAPATPPPPSACPQYPPAPVLADAAALRNQKAVNAGTETVNAWITQYQTVGACRRAEVVALQAEIDARVGEFKDGNARAMQVRDQWQATVDAVAAQGQKKKK